MTDEGFDKLYWLSPREGGLEFFGPLSKGNYDVHDDECSCPRDEYVGVESQRWGGGELNSIPEIVEFLFKGKEWNGDLNDYPYYRRALTVFPCVDLPEDNPPDAHQIFEWVFQLSQSLHAARGTRRSLERGVWEHPRKAAMIAGQENLCKTLADLGSEYQAMFVERLEGIPPEQLLAWTKDMVDEIVDEPSNYVWSSPLDRFPPEGT